VHPRAKDFGSLLDAGARHHGSSTAAIIGDSRLTYDELRDRSGRVARGLADHGIQPGERIALWADNSIEWLITYLAVGAMGATLVPLNTRFRRNELAHTLRLTRAKLAIVGPGIQSAPFPALLREVAGAPRNGHIESATFPDLKLAFFLGPDHEEGFLPWANLESTKATDGWEGTPNSIAFIQFTSGTTGLPKGVALSAGSMLVNSSQVADRLEMDASTRVMFPGPLYHVLGAVLATLGPLGRGGAVVLLPTFHAERSLALIEQERCTVHFGLETMLVEQLAAQEARPRDLSSLRNGMMAGPPALIRAVHDKLHLPGVVTGYGMSETTASAATTVPADPLEVRMTTVGYPLDGCEIRIINPKSGLLAEPGARGEICLRGTNIFSHYDNDPDATAAAFDKDGWFHSGDEGSFDLSGRLRFHGRMNETIRVGGENVSPMEVETLIGLHPAVKMVQVVGVPDERLQQIPVAFIEPHAGAAIADSELLAWCRGQLASFKLPRHVVTVEEWPLTGTGRIQRAELRRRWTEQQRHP
jgi:fatty-acyl-CoA synthase